MRFKEHALGHIIYKWTTKIPKDTPLQVDQISLENHEFRPSLVPAIWTDHRRIGDGGWQSQPVMWLTVLPAQPYYSGVTVKGKANARPTKRKIARFGDLDRSAACLRPLFSDGLRSLRVSVYFVHLYTRVSGKTRFSRGSGISHTGLASRCKIAQERMWLSIMWLREKVDPPWRRRGGGSGDAATR